MTSSEQAHTSEVTDQLAEIDYHMKFFHKHAHEVKYGEECPICNSRIDEYLWCACGAGGS